MDAHLLESPLGVTKIILQSKRKNLLARPRLIDFLHQHIERKLILVSASAGYGKTSLLIDFAHDTPLPVCWYSLDANDTDPKVFLEYLIQSLRRKFPDFGTRTSRLVSESGLKLDADAIAGSLVTEMYEDIPNYFVLILDDYQLVEDAVTVNMILDALLRMLPENAHLILSGRTLPKQLTLTRLTARQEIAGVGMNELKFSAGEIRALVKQNFQVDLSERDAAELAEKSEGWIAGILLTTQSLWKGLFQSLVSVPGSHSQVFNFLASEVFNQQSIELQRFLLDSAVLTQFNAQICDELFDHGNSEGFLAEIEQKNLFITRVDDQEAWYRYHHLFQEFLETRLQESDRARWEALHLRAADLFATHRAWDVTIGHYLKVGAFELAAQAVEQIAKEIFDLGHWATLAKWIDALPEQVIQSHPSLLIWRARILADTGELDRALQLYDRLLVQFEKLGDQDGIGKILVRKGICLRFQGNYAEAIQLSQRALSLLDSSSKREIADAHRTIGISKGFRGNWTECRDELVLALGYYDEQVDHADVALIHHDLGVASRTMGDKTAQKHFQMALDHWLLANNSLGQANTLNSMGVSYHRQGDYAKAIDVLQKAQLEAQRSAQFRIQAHVLASLGDVYRDQAAFTKAQDAYRSAYEIGRQIGEGFIITYTLCALGELLTSLGDARAANQLLASALEQAESHQSGYEIGLAKTALGISSCENGELTNAESYLSGAIELFEEGGSKRESARARLHLARTNLLRKNYRHASKNLQITATLGRHLQEDQFMVGDRQRVVSVLKYAVAKKIGNGYFAHALQKIQTLPTDRLTEEPAIESVRLAIQAFALGTARVLVNGKSITTTAWGSATAKELFFLLLSHPQGLRKEEILERLWQDVPVAKANAIFHSTSHRARRALGSNCVVYEDGVYRLSKDIQVWADVKEFKQFIDRAERAKTDDERAAHLQQAIVLYGGDYFEDSYSDWCNPIRSLLHSKYLDALCALASYHTLHSNTADALMLYRKIIEKDPAREEIYREMMQLQAQTGDRSGAIRIFEECERALAEELGLRPSEETQSLYQRILTGKDFP